MKWKGNLLPANTKANVVIVPSPNNCTVKLCDVNCVSVVSELNAHHFQVDRGGRTNRALSSRNL